MTQDDDLDAVIEPSPPPKTTHSARAPSSASSKKDAVGSTSVPARKQNEPPFRKKITAAEKKRRDVCRSPDMRVADGGILSNLSLQAIVEPIIDTMPLEYRGSDPVSPLPVATSTHRKYAHRVISTLKTQKQLATKVVLALIAAGERGIRRKYKVRIYTRAG